VVRCTFSPPRNWRPAVAARLARTLGITLGPQELFWLVLVGLFTMVILSPILFAGRWLWRKGRVARVGLVALGFAFLWLVYRALYPSDSYYFQTLEGLTGIKLGPSLVILEKTATYPDMHGDYQACFIARLQPSDIHALLAQITEPSVPTETFFPCETSQSEYASPGTYYDLSARTGRGDASVQISVYRNENTIRVRWSLW
jgi:hypothetical protein